MSSPDLRTLEPKALWNCFAELNAVPRPSKREERVVGFVLGFAARHGLEAQLERPGNVIVKKPANGGPAGASSGDHAGASGHGAQSRRRSEV